MDKPITKEELEIIIDAGDCNHCPLFPVCNYDCYTTYNKWLEGEQRTMEKENTVDKPIICKCGHGSFWYFGDCVRCQGCLREYGKSRFTEMILTREWNIKSREYGQWEDIESMFESEENHNDK